MSKAGRNRFLRTNLGNGGRYAGTGVYCDDYSEESGNTYEERRRPIVRFPLDKRTPESLNGEVIVVQKGMKKDGEE